MIDSSKFFNELKANGVSFFTGVPDSLLKDLGSFITDNTNESNHIIAANEGAAVGLAIGNYLATNNVPLVYMQNSGLGNAINPLLSIASPEVYSIPVLMVIGWRGEPDVADEPQHKKQGLVTEALLDSMDIPYDIIDSTSDITKIIRSAVNHAAKQKMPYALLVKKNSFEPYKLKSVRKTSYEMNREEAVKLLIDNLKKDDIVISTTGKTSREVFEYRELLHHGHEKDFLTVGAMGHTSQIALGVALSKPNRTIYCFDGDGSVIMHMGSLAINGSLQNIENFNHIVINNEAHDSVGGQPTAASSIDFSGIATACGYTYVSSVQTSGELLGELNKMNWHKGRCFLEIKVNKGARSNLGRPTNSPSENKLLFQEFVQA